MTHLIEDTEMLSASELLQGFLSTASKMACDEATLAVENGASDDQVQRAAVAGASFVLERTSMCENTGAMVDPDDACFMTGRGPTGRCRNFRQMSDGKLLNVLYDVRNERNDDYAFDAIVAEATSRGLSF